MTIVLSVLFRKPTEHKRTQFRGPNSLDSYRSTHMVSKGSKIRCLLL